MPCSCHGCAIFRKQGPPGAICSLWVAPWSWTVAGANYEILVTIIDLIQQLSWRTLRKSAVDGTPCLSLSSLCSLPQPGSSELWPDALFIAMSNFSQQFQQAEQQKRKQAHPITLPTPAL